MLKFSEILEFSKEKFRKIPILKEFEWFEWFEMVRMVRSLADRTFQLWCSRGGEGLLKPLGALRLAPDTRQLPPAPTLPAKIVPCATTPTLATSSSAVQGGPSCHPLPLPSTRQDTSRVARHGRARRLHSSSGSEASTDSPMLRRTSLSPDEPYS